MDAKQRTNEEPHAAPAAEPASTLRPDEEPPEFNPAQLAAIIESLLFAAGSPVSFRRLVEVLGGPSATEVREALELLRQDYAPGKRGIQLVEVAGGYQLRTAREHAVWVRALLQEKPPRLGRAALETLAIVAYKQPVTKAEIEAIRGVDCDGSLQTLLSRRLIKIAGRKDTVGRPLLYATTNEFLETFGLKDLHDLPALQELTSALESLNIAESTTHDIGQQTALPLSGEEPLQQVEPPTPTVTENSGARGPDLAPASGTVDPRGPGAGERPSGNGAWKQS
ncbi:Segregation and condensation protein B [bacterium HR30]|nr:Segregation and condensation protein B [bacterium HR30]